MRLFGECVLLTFGASLDQSSTSRSPNVVFTVTYWNEEEYESVKNTSQKIEEGRKRVHVFIDKNTNSKREGVGRGNLNFQKKKEKQHKAEEKVKS